VRWPLLAELAVLVGLTAATAVAFGLGLHAAALYDEGVYLASLDALVHGQRLGTDVFTSQGPGLYLLLEAERALFGGSIVALRVAMLVLSIAGCLSAYFVGRSIAGPRAGILALALLAAWSQIEDEATRVRADFPSVAFSLIAIALALFAIGRRGAAGPVAAALAGGALAAAISIKLLAAAALAPLVALVLRARARGVAIVMGAGAAVVVAAIVGNYASALGAIWNDVVRYHLDTESAALPKAPRGLGGHLAKLLDTLSNSNGVRSPFPWLILVGAAGTLLAWRRRQLFAAIPLWLWAAVLAALLIWHNPLWAHDVVPLTASLALTSGVGLAALLADSRAVSRAAGAACALVVAVTLTYHLVRTPPGESAGILWAAAVLRAHTPEGSTVASDLPIVPFLADRRQPANLVDTSNTRVLSGWLKRSAILRSIERDHVSAVVIGQNFGLDRRLVRAVHARFPVVVYRNGVVQPGKKPRTLRIYLPPGR
jgi:4-amino-4-deoxy-L-arabinose transferase-like glycosyltransferase